MIVLEAKEVEFYSQNDERVFFEWVEKLPIVCNVYGKGFSIYIDVNDSEVNETQLRELLAIFYRYRIDMRQLAVFDCNEFSEWYRNRKSYWYDLVFD